MGRIVIEEVDEVVIDGSARLPASNCTSAEERVKTSLTQSMPRPSRQDLVRRAEAISAMTPTGVIQTDATLLLRQDRDR